MKIRGILSAVTLLLMGGALILQIPSCTHDDVLDVGIDPPDYEYGTDEVSSTDGWTFDRNHSSVRWETAYLGSSALLTGRFNTFAIQLNFVEDRPESITIDASVTLSTVNTGIPGRDGGCLQGTLGVTAEPFREEATFTSKSVEFDNVGGYDVVGDLDFHGVTDEVTMKLRYVGSTHFAADSGVSGAPKTVAGFEGEFEINAKSVFGIESASIADRVVVKVSASYNKPD